MSATPDQINISMQISAVEREIAMRRGVYPKLVAQGKMKQSQAEIQIVAMEAVLATLKRVQAT